MKSPWFAPLALGALLAACPGETAPPRAQWKVYLATDAPVPQLGQQVLVELIDASGAPVASNLRRYLDASRPELWPISFGIVPDEGAPAPRVRARLYRLDDAADDGEPSGTMVIDATATLPPSGGQITETALQLAMACFGVSADPANRLTCNPATGQLDAEPTPSAGVDQGSLPQVGSWPPAAPVPCSGSIPPGMGCAPGGVFILGNIHYFPAGEDPVPEHLVQLPPFAIDLDEVTVKDVRALVQAGKIPQPIVGDTDPADTPPECTYLGQTDESHDAYPINCVSWTTASDVCQLLGKRLPTEAEWEYVADGLGTKLAYPWGSDPDICHYAVVSKGRAGLGQPEPYECIVPPEPAGPHAHDGSDLDILAATVPGLGGQVLDLAGNVNEWVADVYDDYTGPCWQGAQPLVAPLCTASMAKASLHVTRGGSWQLQAFSASAYLRDSAITDGPAVSTGFRCALSLP